MAGAYEIRERDIGGVLDEAIFLFRDNIKFIAIVAGLFVFPFVLGADLLSAFLTPDQIIGNPESGMDPSEQMEALGSIWVWGVLVGSGLSLLSVIGICLSDAAIIYGIGYRYLGHEITVGASLRTSLRFLLKLIVLQMVVGVLAGLGFCLCIIPGFVLSALFFLVPSVLILEQSTMSEALSRSPRLVYTSLWPTVTLILVLVVIGAGIGAFAAIIPSNISYHVLYAVTQTAYRAFEAVVGVVLYFSARCRSEALDLDLLANQVDVAPTDEATL